MYNTHYPIPTYFQDKKPGSMFSKISGVPDYEYFETQPFVNLATVGAPWDQTEAERANTANVPGSTTLEASTGSKIGSGLLAVTPALATIPVVGWIAGAATGIIGGLLKAFGGKKEPESTQVRDLVKHYRINVKAMDGGPKSNSKNVTVAEADEAQSWFSVVTGVPIYDMLRINALNKLPTSAAVAAYKEFPESAGISDANIIQAANIVNQYMYPKMGNDDKGFLQNMVAARVQTNEDLNPQTLTGGGVENPTIQTLNSTGMAETTSTPVSVPGLLTGNPLTMLVLLGGGGWLVYEMTKKKKRVAGIGKIDNTQLLVVGGLGLAGLFLYMRSKQSTPAPQTTLPYYQQQQQQQQSSGGGSNVWDALTSLFGSAATVYASTR
jgi:hypothetical protein